MGEGMFDAKDLKIVALELVIERLIAILSGAGFIVDHPFTPDPDKPDDGSCMLCDGVSDDHIAQ